MTVTEGIYEINNPDENSPVMVTTNFALTYFIVSGEIEGSKVPTWLLIKDSEGLSVMTAWAAGKFAGDDVGMFVKKSGIMDKVKTPNSSFPAMPPPSPATWKRNCPAGPSPSVPGRPRIIPGFLKA
jgi:acetyl-CoA decarbonylase/synthase complex subunit gamma